MCGRSLLKTVFALSQHINQKVFNAVNSVNAEIRGPLRLCLRKAEKLHIGIN